MLDWTDPARKSEVVDISSTDYTFTSLTISALHNATSSGGTVVAKLLGDTGNSTWYIAAGKSVPGCFAKVIKSGTSLTAANAIIGLTSNPANG